MIKLRRRARTDEVLLGLLEEAGRNAERAGVLLRELLSQFPDRSGLAREILLCEQEGDRITHDIMHRLGSNGTPPKLAQADVHALATALDDIVDYTEEAADSLGIYGVEAPMEQAERLAEVLVNAAAAVSGALATLRTQANPSARLVEIHQFENEGDRISRDAIAALFKGGIDPMVVIRWKDIFESLEQAIDSCETVAHILEGIAFKAGQ